MVRLLLYVVDLVIAWLVWQLIAGAIRQVLGGRPSNFNPPRHANPFGPSSAKTPTIHGETARDPLCGMFVSTELSHRLKHDGQTLHFCSRECLERYEQGLGTRS
jgi:YHS domain-containing protein